MADYEILADGDADSGGYEVLADGDNDYSSASDLPASIAKKAYGGAVNSIGGVVSALEDYGKYLSPLGMLQPDMKEDYKVGDDIVRYAQGVLNDANKKYNFEPGSASYYGDMVGSTVAQTLPVMLSGPAAPALMLAQQAGSDYATAKTEGQTDRTALIRSALNAPINYLSNKFTLGALTKPGSSLPRRLLESELTNLATSIPQTIGNTLVNSNTGQGPVSPEDFQKRIVENLITDAGVGVVSPLAAHPFIRASAKRAEAAEAGRIDAMAEQMRLASEAEASRTAEINQIVDSKTTLPGEDVAVTNQLQDAAQVVPDNGPRIIDFNPVEQTGIIPETSTARTPDYQAELEAAAKPQTQLIVDESGNPLNAPPIQPSGEVVSPFTKTGEVRKALPTDEQAVIKELKLSEQRRKQLESQALPAVVKPEAKTPEVSKAINASTFPKIQEYVQKNIPDKGAQEGFVNSLKLQREAQAARVPLIEYQRKIVSDAAVREFPEASKPIDPENAIEFAEQVETAYKNPNSRIQLLAEPAIGGAKPAYLEYGKVSDVAVNPKLFQIRDRVEGKYGTKNANKIRGKWDDVKSGPLIVYEPKLENRERVSLGKPQVVDDGHHRHEGAEERGVKNYLKIILREEDGWTIEDAKIYGAEKNISQGSTSSIDTATIVRFARKAYGEEGLTAIKRNIGEKGKEGRIIGEYATDRLWHEYASGKIKDDATVRVIAETAPLDKELQDYGISLATGENAKAASVIRDRMLAKAGGEISDPVYMKLVDDAILRRTQSLNETIAALAPLKSEAKGQVSLETLVAKFGPDFLSRKPELLAELADATKEKAKYEKGAWRNDPDIKYAIRKEVQPSYDQHLAAKQEQDSLQRVLFDPAPKTEAEVAESKETINDIKKWVKGQRGSVVNPFAKPREAIKATLENLDDKEVRKIVSEFGKKMDMQIESVRKLGLEKALEYETVNAMIFPKSVAKIEPSFRPFIDYAETGKEKKFTIAHDLSEKAAPFMIKDSNGKVWELAAAARIAGKSFDWTPENFAKYGADEGDIKALMAMKDTAQAGLEIVRQVKTQEALMDYEQMLDHVKKGTTGRLAALNQTRPLEENKAAEFDRKQALLAELQTMPYTEETAGLIQKKLEQHTKSIITRIDNEINGLKADNYVPFVRSGDKFVQAKDPSTGKTVYFALFKTNKQKVEAIARFEKIKKETGLTVPLIEGDFGNNPESLYGGNSAVGFSQHLMKSKNVAGYHKNMKMAFAEYITGLSNYAAKSYMKKGFEKAYQGLPENSPEIAKYAQKYATYQLSDKSESALVRKVLTAWFLGGRISSAAINLTQQFSTTLPKAQSEVGTLKASKYWANAQSIALQRLMNPEKLAKTNPEINAVLDIALKQGSLTENSFRELTGRARSDIGEISRFDKTMDASMAFFGAAEAWNRYHAFLVGYQIAQSKGLSPDSAIKYAKDFNSDTQFDYSKVNRPRVARGALGAPVMTFQLFKFNQLAFFSNLLKATTKGDMKAAQGLATNIAVGVSLAGMTGAFPFAKELLSVLEGFGVDAKQAMRDAFKDNEFVQDLLESGLTYAAGFASTGGATQMEFVPIQDDFNKDSIPWTVGKVVTGVPGAAAQQVYEAAQLASEGKYMKAVQRFAPSSISGLLKGGEAGNTGKVTTKRGETMYEDPTGGEIASMLMGFNPNRSQKFHNTSRAVQLYGKKAVDNDDINRKIAEARNNGDRAKEAQLRSDNAAKQANKAFGERKTFPNPTAIKQLEYGLKNPIDAAIRRMPKEVQADARRKFGVKPSYP